MKNYAQKTNKQMTRYRTSSTFRGNVKFNQPILKRDSFGGIDNRYVNRFSKNVTPNETEKQ